MIVVLDWFVAQQVTTSGDGFDLIKILAAVAAIIAAGAGAGAVIKSLTTERRAATRDDLNSAWARARDAMAEATAARAEAAAADDKLELVRREHHAEIDALRTKHTAELVAIEARFVRRIDALVERVNLLLDENVELRRRLTSGD